MSRTAQVLIFSLLISLVAGCGGSSTSSSGSSTPAPVISVSISPTFGNVQAGATLQFATTVSGTTNTAVTWQVNGVTGGGTSTGTVSSLGLYAAPSSVPSPNALMVTAISVADPTKSASASLTITPPPVSVSLSPTTASVITRHSQQFTASVSNTSNAVVTWSVNGTAGGSSTVGQISATGLYTAPQAVPNPATVNVVATSAADPSKSASAQVTVLTPPVPTGTWSELGPYGATDQAQIVADPRDVKTMYLAAVHGGLYKTMDSGKTWLSLLPFTGFPVSLVVAPSSGTVYALGEKQFQTSTDGGKTFSAATSYPNSLDTESTALTFAVDPKNDQTVYILTSTSLLRSKDGGANWTALSVPPSPFIDNGYDHPLLGALVVSSGNSSVLLATTKRGLAISSDGGATWNVRTSGMDTSFLSLIQIIQDPNNPSRLLSLGSYSNPPSTSPNAKVYSSADGGTTWTTVTTVGVSDRIPAIQTGPGLYVLYGGTLYVTFNNGSSFQNISPPTDPSGLAASVSPVSPLTIAYEGRNDIFTSQDGGSTWTLSEAGISARMMGQVVFAGTAGPLYANTLYPVPGDTSVSTQLWSNPGSASSFSRLLDARSNLPIYQFTVDPKNPLRLLGVEYGTGSISNIYSVISSDGGLTWTTIPYANGMATGFELQQYSVLTFGSSGSNSAYACGSFGVARLSLSTQAWSIVNNGIPSGTTCNSLAADGLSSGTVYAATTAGVYKTTDGGNNWSLVLAASGFYTTTLVDPANGSNVFVSAALGRGGLSMRSTDGGKTWSQMSVEGPLAIQPGNSNILYSIIENAGLAVSYDSGLTWGTTTTPYQEQMDLAVLPSGQVIISTAGRGLVEFTPK